MQNFTNLKFKKCNFFIVLIILFITGFIKAQTRTIQPGSVIINMGITPQTYSNGLKPYGLVYNLLDIQKVPVVWSIDPTKVKDGIDFSVDGIDFKGGTFVIEKQFAVFSNVQATIASFVSQGVVVHTTTAPVTIPIYKELTAFPKWVMDFDNGNIAIGYLTNAGIPSTAYRKALPTDLNNCDDLFILPHADPTWVTHGLPLLTWNGPISNGGSAGWIWAGCHAVSVLENLGNTVPNATLRTNFLSDDGMFRYKSFTSEGSTNAITGNLNPIHNNTGVPPYTTLYPSDAVMQFMGNTDGAHNGGSERIYLPTNGWRATTKVSVFDPNHVQATGIFPDQVALIAYGYAFGDSNRGKVMYEAGHVLTNGTTAEDTAAQRAFLNFSFDAPTQKAPVINSITSISSEIPHQTVIPLSVSATAFGGGTVDYLWSSSCGGTFSSTTTSSTDYTAPTLVAGSSDINCLISVKITDSCGREVFYSYSVLIKAPVQSDLEVIKTVDNATPNVGSNVTFTITASNNGPNNATGVVVTDNIPTGYTIISATPSVGSWSSNNWTIGNLANGALATLTIVATVNTTGIYANTATILGSVIDTDSTNNSSTATTVPVPLTDLTVTKTISNTTPSVGSNVTFTITATNNGPSAATGVVVTDNIPSGYTLVSATPSFGIWTNPTWSIGNLANGGSATLTVVATVNASGVYSNIATVTGAESDSNLSNNSSTSTPIPINVIDAVNDSYGPINGYTGATTASILSNDTINGVIVNPSEITLTPVTVPTGLTLNANGTITVAPGTAAGAYTVTYTICEVLNPTNCDTANALVTVAPPVIDAVNDSYGPINGYIGAITASVLTNDTLNGVVVNPSQISLTPVTVPTGLTLNANGTITVAPGTAAGTYTVTYTICEVLNPTNCDTANALVTVAPPVIDAVNDSYGPINGYIGATTASVLTNDTLNGVVVNPSEITLTPVTVPTGLTLNANGTITVAPGTAAGTYTVTYTICEVLNPTNCDTANAIITIFPNADLSITKVVNNISPNVGSDVTFIITVTNNGLDLATAVVVTDNIPSGYSLVSASPSVGTWTNPTWNIGNLANGGSATLTVVATVNATGVYSNTASVTGAESDPNLSNNSSTSTPIPVPQADLVVTKTVNNLLPNVGSNILFTITVTNNGPSAASGVVVTENIPSGYTLVSVSPSVGTWTNPTWNIGNLNNGGSATLTVVATVNATGVYSNTASVTGAESDPNLSNNSSTSTPIPVNVIDAVNDDYSLLPLTTGIGGNYTISDNDTLNGLPFNPYDVVYTIVDNGGIDGASIGPNGVLNIPSTVLPGTYTLVYTICELNQPNNCDTATVILVILPCDSIIVHNAFTPNGDGINEWFQIDNIDNFICYPSNTVEIYNRWGVLVYETKNYDNNTRRFEGVSEGRVTVNKSSELPTGVYFYIIQSKTINGQNVTKDGYLYLTR